MYLACCTADAKVF